MIDQNSTIYKLLALASQKKASDIFLVAGRPATFKINGHLENQGERLMPDDTEKLISEIYSLANRSMDMLVNSGDDDFALSIANLSRFRVNTYRQRNSLASVIRIIKLDLPKPEELNIPSSVTSVSNYTKGLVLVTGSAGSGKSTTLACIIDKINHSREGHIITLEEPLEFLHRHDKCIVTQREISSDSESYLVSLRATLRQSPDVILLGEMRDLETIQTAMTAAETGHLVFSSLHTVGAANTISRIIDVFDAHQQQQIAVQLSLVLQAVVSQQLVPDINGQPVPVFEIMTLTPAIRNMIRDNKIHQLDGVISSSAKDNMISMDQSLLNLYQKGIITKEIAMRYSANPLMLKKKL